LSLTGVKNGNHTPLFDIYIEITSIINYNQLTAGLAPAAPAVQLCCAAFLGYSNRNAVYLLS